MVSLSNKALVELKGEPNLFTPHFYKEGKEIEIEKIDVSKEQYYLPRLDFFLIGLPSIISTFSKRNDSDAQ